jgi:sugar lactone lactonase YvrE
MLLAAAVAAGAACARSPRRAAPGVPSSPAAAASVRRDTGQQLAVVTGLADPEALVFDPAQNVYFVSNVNGNPGVKDGNGFIARIRADGSLDSLHFIQGGRGGVVLNAPMGSRVRGDTLWVLDVDVLRAFDTRSGAPLASIDFAPLGALFLNDLAFGPGGDIYITDTGVRVSGTPAGHTGPDRIYRVGKDRKPVVALDTSALKLPDGIDWEPAAQRFVLAPFGGTHVQSWRPGAAGPSDVAPGAGKFDGIEVQRDGTILITTWNDSSVSQLNSGPDGAGAVLVRRLGPLGAPPADVSMDARRRQVGIVSLTANRFELWTLPK